MAFDPAIFILLGCGVNGAIASGDFTNIATNNAADGIYTLNGAPCAIGDIIDLDHPDIYFDPLIDIDAEGLKARDLGGGSYNGLVLEMNEPLLTTLLGGFTLLLEGLFGAAPGDGDLTVLPHDTAYAINTFASATISLTNLFAIDETEYNGPSEVTPSAINKVAFTMTANRMAVSINGGTAHAVEAGCLADIDFIQMQTGGGPDNRLRSFAFYEVVDDADLPTLSAL